MLLSLQNIKPKEETKTSEDNKGVLVIVCAKNYGGCGYFASHRDWGPDVQCDGFIDYALCPDCGKNNATFGLTDCNIHTLIDNEPDRKKARTLMKGK